MRLAVTFAAALTLVAPLTGAERLSDEDVERLLEDVERDVDALAREAERDDPAELAELLQAAAAMRARFGEDDTAGEAVVEFLRRAHEDGELRWPRLRENVERLAEVYGVDRSLEPALWRPLRMNDRELVAVLDSLARVAQPFERQLREISRLLDPCTILESEREAILENAARLERDAEALRAAVERDRGGSEELARLMSTADALRAFLERHSITRVMRDTWGPVERDLSQVERAFGYEPG